MSAQKPKNNVRYKIIRQRRLKFSRHASRWADLMRKDKDGKWLKVKRYDSADEALAVLIVKLGYRDILQSLKFNE